MRHGEEDQGKERHGQERQEEDRHGREEARDRGVFERPAAAGAGRGRRPLLVRRARHPGGPKNKGAGKDTMASMADPLGDLQERLYAASTAGGRARVLLVLQGMDTSGKGGTVKHVIGLFNPPGCRSGPSRRRPGGAAATPSCGGSGRPCRSRARSASSTGRTTRTCWSRGSASWSPATSEPPLRPDQPLREVTGRRAV